MWYESSGVKRWTIGLWVLALGLSSTCPDEHRQGLIPGLNRLVLVGLQYSF